MVVSFSADYGPTDDIHSNLGLLATEFDLMAAKPPINHSNRVTKMNALKWHGGKTYLAKKIIKLMPRHLNYVEPYFGGGAVLFERDPNDLRFACGLNKGVSEIVNDIDGRLINFWTVLRDRQLYTDFFRMCQATPFSGDIFASTFNLLDSPDPVEQAWAFFVNCRQSLAGRMKGFTGITKNRTRNQMNNEVSAWLRAIDGLQMVHERLQRVLILPSQPAINVIRTFDIPDTLFYLDPPYLRSTRVTYNEYRYEMSKAQHAQLLQVIRGCEAKVMISGYSSPLYEEMLKGWERFEFPLPNNASQAKVKETKIEIVWCNFEPRRV